MCSSWREELTIRSLELKGKDIPQDFVILIHWLGSNDAENLKMTTNLQLELADSNVLLKKRIKNEIHVIIMNKIISTLYPSQILWGKASKCKQIRFFFRTHPECFFSFLGRILWMQNPVGWQRNSGTKFRWILVLNNFICRTWNVTFLKRIIVRRAWGSMDIMLDSRSHNLCHSPGTQMKRKINGEKSMKNH